MKQEYVVGFHPIQEALKSAGPSSVLFLDTREAKRNLMLAGEARKLNIPVKHVSSSELDRMAGQLVNHKGALLTYSRSITAAKQFSDVKGFIRWLGDTKRSVVLFLDGITDPHNLGAILRSADMFGVDMVVVPERRSVHQNATVMEVSSGAAKYVPLVVVKNLVRDMQLLQKEGFWFYGADMGGQAVGSMKLSGRLGIVMGAEGSGLSRLVRESCDSIISIPTNGHIDSLNVSVAAGILLYELSKTQ
jgi:23S rRNA (guanosine2251-2'-O)-methyltransferase